MTKTLRERIVAFLGRDINRLFSISDISKNLGAAYSHCNKFIREMESEGILRMIKIANSHIITLNLSEPLTISMLCTLEYHKLKNWKVKNKPKSAKLNLFLNRIENINIESIFVSKTNIIILVKKIDNTINAEINNHNLGLSYVIIDKDKFVQEQDAFLKDHVVFYGAERFWQSVKKELKIE